MVYSTRLLAANISLIANGQSTTLYLKSSHKEDSGSLSLLNLTKDKNFIQDAKTLEESYKIAICFLPTAFGTFNWSLLVHCGCRSPRATTSVLYASSLKTTPCESKFAKWKYTNSQCRVNADTFQYWITMSCEWPSILKKHRPAGIAELAYKSTIPPYPGRQSWTSHYSWLEVSMWKRPLFHIPGLC